MQSLSSDAVNDEKRGAIFPATLVLGMEAIDVDGKTIQLTPGMNLTAEIKIRRRRVMEYFLSPISVKFQASGRER